MAFEAASVIEAFAAWSLARVLRSVTSAAGGIGVVELGLTGACSASEGNGESWWLCPSTASWGRRP